MKKLVTLTFIFIATTFIMIGCDEAPTNDADADQAAKTERAMKDANAQIGMPAIINWQENI